MQAALLSPALAVTVAVPTAMAETLPLASTVAMALSLLLQVTVLSVALSGATVAVRVSVSPTCRAMEDRLRVTDVTGTGLTVTVQAALLSPALAVTVAVPTPRAVIRPVPSTKTTALSLLLQVTVLSVALSGPTVAVRDAVPPTCRVSEVLSRVTDVTGMAVTVM